MSDGPDALRSFTTFVLPFWYELAHWPEGERSSARYVQHPPTAERRRYFTAETACPLYDYARWFRLEGNGASQDAWWRCIPWGEGRDGRRLVACFTAPEVVLFEHPGPQWITELASNPEAQRKPSEHDELMEVGFLLLTACLQPWDGDRTNGPRLSDLLAFNETFRYLRADYPGWLDSDQPAVRLGTWDLWRHLAAPSGASREQVPDPDGRDLFDGWSWFLSQPVEMVTEKGTTTTFSMLGAPRDQKQWHHRAWTLLHEGRHAPTTGPGDAARAPHPRGWLLYTDHRAFVWTSAILQDADAEAVPSDIVAAPELWPDWRRLLNVDLPDAGLPDGLPPEAPSSFERQWTRERTYERWAAQGTYYGFCGHAGALLMQHFGGLWHVPAVFRGAYRDLALILLYDRTVAFAISNRLAERARERRIGGNELRPELGAESELRAVLEYFTNVYRYPLLSNQQQAIEMYPLARAAMDVDAVVAEIEKQLQATDAMLTGRQAAVSGDQQLALARASTQMAVTSGQLTVAATAIAGVTIAAQLLTIGPESGLLGEVVDGIRGAPQCPLGTRGCLLLNWGLAVLLVLVASVVVLWFLRSKRLIGRLAPSSHAEPPPPDGGTPRATALPPSAPP